MTTAFPLPCRASGGQVSGLSLPQVRDNYLVPGAADNFRGHVDCVGLASGKL